MVNLALKGALVSQFGSQTVACRALGISETRLSRILRGHSIPSEKELKALRLAFGEAVIKQFSFQGIESRV